MSESTCPTCGKSVRVVNGRIDGHPGKRAIVCSGAYKFVKTTVQHSTVRGEGDK